MSRSLEARTRPEFYAKTVAHLREHGIGEADIEKHVAAQINEARMLLVGKCPKCGAPSARYIDYNWQHGPSNMPGVWVMYRCSTSPPPGAPGPRPCGFMVDFKEAEASN